MNEGAPAWGGAGGSYLWPPSRPSQAIINLTIRAAEQRGLVRGDGGADGWPEPLNEAGHGLGPHFLRARINEKERKKVPLFLGHSGRGKSLQSPEEFYTRRNGTGGRGK